MEFENAIEKIETYIEKRDEEINQIGCSCGKQADLDKLQLEYDTSVRKAEQLMEINLKSKK